MKKLMRTFPRVFGTQDHPHVQGKAAKKMLRPHGRVPNASMSIDVSGLVVNCTPSAGRMLQGAGTGLAGRAIRDVFPELPFSANTPGYNLAYAIFHAAGKHWVRRVALLKDGRSVSIETRLSTVVGEGGREISMSLRPVLAGRRQPLSVCAI